MPGSDLWRTAVRTLLPDAPGVPDAELLARFRSARDEAAFELLLYRHGPMIWATCRRLLRDQHAAEDAFQATFLALARRAGSVRRTQSVPAWLHRVAVRAGLYLLRRREQEHVVPPDPRPEPIDPSPTPAERAAAADAAAHIDAAINRLPERLRRVVILCELHGASLTEAAAQFRCPVGTVASRLARARERLRRMLSARGLAVGSLAGLFATKLVPSEVRAAALRAAVGRGSLSPALAALTRHIGGPNGAGTAYALAGSLAAGLAAVAIAVGAAVQSGPKEKPSAKDAPRIAEERVVAEDAPLPAGAIARIGSSRFRTDMFFTDFAFSPDGKLVAGASRGRRFSVWEVATGRELVAVRESVGEFGRVQFTADGKHVVVGRFNGGEAGPYRGKEVNCYDARTGRLVFRVGDNTFPVVWGNTGQPLEHEWKLGPDDTLRVQGYAGAPVRELRAFELAGGRETGRTRVPAGGTLLDWDQDGTRLLLKSGERLAWHDVKTGRATWQFDSGGRKDAAYALTPGGKRIVTREGSRLRVHDLAGGRATADVRLPDGVSGPEAYLSVPHDRYAVCRRESRAGPADFAVVDLDRGEVCLSLPAFAVSHTWTFSPDGRFLAARAGLATSIWDLTRRSSDPVARLPGGFGARFSPDGRVVALDGGGCVALYDVATWRLLPQSASPASFVWDVRFTPDGRGLFALAADGWRTWDDWSKPASRPLFGPADHRSAGSRLSEDTQVVAEVVDAGSLGPKAPAAAEIRVTDRRTGRTHAHPLAASRDRHVVLSGDGRRVFTWTQLGDEEGEVRGWDTTTGEALPTGRIPQLRTSLAATPDGRWLALLPGAGGAAPDHEGIRLWDVDRGREIGRLKGVSGTGNRGHQEACFSRDGHRLGALVFADDPTFWPSVRVWDWRAGKQLMSVGVVDFMSMVALSPDGRSCAVGDDNGRVRVFEVASGGERAAFRHAAWLGSLAFNPAGTRLAACSSEAPVYVWDLLGNPGRWDPARADAVWTDLGSADAKLAIAAIQKLRANPAEAISFLRDRVKLPAVPPEEAVASLLKRLDAPAFADRERAQKELATVVEWVRPKLEAARKTASEEASRRIDQVLRSADSLTSEQLRQVRACEVLEGIRSPDAVGLLRAWADGPPAARLTIEAKESLDRLKP